MPSCEGKDARHGVVYLDNAATGVIFPITVIGWVVSLFFGDGSVAALKKSRVKEFNVYR